MREVETLPFRPHTEYNGYSRTTREGSSAMSNSSETQGKRPLLSDRNYTILKHISAIGLPSVGALYFALASLWHLPSAEQVVGSIAAVNVFMGGLMGAAQSSLQRE